MRVNLRRAKALLGRSDVTPSSRRIANRPMPASEARWRAGIFMCTIARENLSRLLKGPSSLFSNHWSMPTSSWERTFVCKSGRLPQKGWTSRRGEFAARPIQSTFSTSGGPTIAGNPTVYSPVIGSREAPCGLMSFGSTSASCLTVLSKCQPRCPRPCRRSSGCQQHPTTQMQSCNLGLFLSSRRLSDPLCKRNHLTLSADAIKSTSHTGLTIHGGDQELLAQ